MSKYTPPPVTLLDVMNALPLTPDAHMYFRVSTRTAPGFKTVYCSVDLVWVRADGWEKVYRRWGRESKAADTASVMRTLLVAAQEAYLWAEGIARSDAAKLAAWELDTPR